MGASRLSMILVAPLLMLGVVPAVAHPILIHYGTIEWSNNELSISIPLDNHCLSHEMRAVGEHVTAEQLAQAIVNSIHAYSHQYGELFSVVTRIDQQKQLAVKVFTLPDDVNTIAVIHKPDYDLPPVARQIQLVRQSNDGHRTNVIRLTSGGNSEVLHKDANTDRCDGFNQFTEPTLYVLYAPRKEDVAVFVEYPCTLLATWPDLLDIENEAIAVESFCKSREKMAAWASQRCQSAGDRSEDKRIQSEDVELIGPLDEVLSKNTGHHYCIYTTRIRIKLFPAMSERSNSMTIRWTGFNGAILRIPVIGKRANDSVMVGVLTPLQDTVECATTEPFQLTVRPTPGE